MPPAIFLRGTINNNPRFPSSFETAQLQTNFKPTFVIVKSGVFLTWFLSAAGPAFGTCAIPIPRSSELGHALDPLVLVHIWLLPQSTLEQLARSIHCLSLRLIDFPLSTRNRFISISPVQAWQRLGNGWYRLFVRRCKSDSEFRHD
jgi:hypothetical protein